MKYFSKKRFTMRQVVGLLTGVFLGITVIAYAAVNIPNVFSSGTTISSSQVNANFTAVANQMPGIEFTSSNSWGGALTGSAQNIASLIVTAPTDGFVWVSFSAHCWITHTTGTNSALDIQISNSSTPAIDFLTTSYRRKQIDPAAASGGYSDSCVTDRVFPVSAGDNNFYLHAYRFTGAGPDYIGNYSMQAIFFPSRY